MPLYVRPVACLVCISFEHVLERSIKVCIKWIWPVGICGTIAPVFVHPEPRRWLFLDVRLKCIPACLCDLLMSQLSGVFDRGMEDEPVTSVRQWLAVRRNDRDPGSLVQPGMRGSDTCL